LQHFAAEKWAFMFEGLFQPTHLLVILVIYLLFFGTKKLPELGKGLGEGIRGLKEALRETHEAATAPTSTPAAPPVEKKQETTPPTP
jgi:sec-independent protein translocase protein TatA